MTFITEEDYAAYAGETVPEEEFDRYAARACEAVDAATGWKITQAGIGSYSEADQAQIVLAACAQLEALWLNGIESMLGASAGSDGGYTIGKTNVYGMKGAGSNASVSAVPQLCGKAVHALFPTGLLYVGVALRC